MLYEEIVKELNQISEEGGRQAKERIEFLFGMCQRYAQNHHMNQKLVDAKDVLKNYLEEENCLTYESKSKQRDREKSMNITSKLYIEFFWDSYKAYYEKDYKGNTEKQFIQDIINGHNYTQEIDKAWNEIWENSDAESIKMKQNIQESISEWIEFAENITGIDKLNLTNLHNAMEIVEKELKTPQINIKDAVEEVLTPQILSLLLEHLKEKRYPHCIFTVAPITRALTVGEIKSFTPEKKSATIFFKENFRYNWKKLDNYIKALQELYIEYVEVKTEIQQFIYFHE